MCASLPLIKALVVVSIRLNSMGGTLYLSGMTTGQFAEYVGLIWQVSHPGSIKDAVIVVVSGLKK